MDMKQRHAQLVMRPAQLPDLEAILDINRNIYNGSDTLHVTFTSMLQSADNNPYVGLIDGRVVAFVNFYVINDGTAVIGMNARIVDEYKNQGLYIKVFGPQALSHVLAEHRRIKEVVFAALGSEGHDSLLNTNDTMKVIHRWNMLIFSAPIKGIQTAIDDLARNEGHSRSVSTSGSLKLIQDGTMASVLKSKSDWFLCSTSCLPFRVTAKNLTFAAKTSDVRGTFEDGILKAVSFSSFTLAPGHLLAAIHVTCDMLNQCQCHIRAFLERAVELSAPGYEQVTLMIHFPSEIDIREIQDRLVQNLEQNMNSQMRIRRTDGVLATSLVSR